MRHLSHRRSILRLGKLLHQLEVSDDVHNGVPKRMAEDWAHCVGYALVALFDEALKASFECGEAANSEGTASTSCATSAGIAGVYVWLPLSARSAKLQASFEMLLSAWNLCNCIVLLLWVGTEQSLARRAMPTSVAFGHTCAVRSRLTRN